jgi:CRP-like cAMP-binding protein
MNMLNSFLLKYVSLSAGELDEIGEKFRSKTVKKNNYLLRHGDTCKDFVIVTKGCLRLYYLKDDIDVSVWFAFPGSSAIEISSYISGNPTEYFLQAIEDSEVLFISKKNFDTFCLQQPKLQLLMKSYWEDVIINLINRFTALQKDSAEMRYLSLLNNPEYLDKIPQKYLASYIGITPTSLSRIRKKIIKNH